LPADKDAPTHSRTISSRKRLCGIKNCFIDNFIRNQ
jgi:hypothetical protein